MSISKVALMMDMCRKLRWKSTDSGQPDSGVLIQARTETASVLRSFLPDIDEGGTKLNSPFHAVPTLKILWDTLPLPYAALITIID